MCIRDRFDTIIKHQNTKDEYNISLCCLTRKIQTKVVFSRIYFMIFLSIQNYGHYLSCYNIHFHIFPFQWQVSLHFKFSCNFLLLPTIRTISSAKASLKIPTLFRFQWPTFNLSLLLTEHILRSLSMNISKDTMSYSFIQCKCLWLCIQIILYMFFIFLIESISCSRFFLFKYTIIFLFV